MTTFTTEDLQNVMANNPDLIKGADHMSDKGYKEANLADAIRFK